MTQRINTIKQIIIIAAVFIIYQNACSGVDRTDKRIIPEKDTLAMKKQLLLLIPIGSDIATAHDIFRSNGFTTEYMVQSDFMETSGPTGQRKLHTKVDFLYADFERSKNILGLIVERWQIAVVHKNGKVFAIYISYGLIGP